MTYGDYPDFNGVGKILIIKFRHLGDVFLSTPVFSILKKRYPNISIDALVYEEANDLLEDHFAIRKVYTRKRKGKKEIFLKRLLNEYLFLKKLKKNRYDLILNLTEGDRGAVVCKYLRPKYRVGVEGKNKGYTHLIKQCSTPRHQVELDLDALRIMGIFPRPDERELYFAIPKNISDNGRNLKNYFLFCPFARWGFKGLSLVQMKKIIDFLINKGQKVVISGSKNVKEMETAKILTNGYPKEKVINLVGNLDIKQLGSVMEKAKGVICIDSFALHLSSCLKKKVVVFFGPTSEIKWGPWQNPNAIVITKNISCRPCLMDGCGGSKYADCLATMDLKKAFYHLEKWIEEPKVLKSKTLTQIL